MAKSKGTRRNYGEITIVHKGRSLNTSVGSLKYESSFGGDAALRKGTMNTGRVPEGYNHRPDLIASLFYATPSAWWIVCERNSIFDVFEQLKSGSSIRIPR